MAINLLQIAMEDHRSGRLVQAERGYRAALEQNPDDAEALHWLGVLLCQAGQSHDAIPLLESAASARPDDSAFHHNLAQAYLAAGRAADAVESLARAVALDPAPQALMALAAARLARKAPGDAERAIDELQQACDGGRDSSELHRYLGIAFVNTARPEEAITALNAAIERKGDDAAAHLNLGLAYCMRGRMDEGRQSLTHAADLDPASARAWQALAMLEAQAGNHEAAEKLFRKVLEIRRDPSAYQGLAHVLRALGRNAEATLADSQATRLAREMKNAAPEAGRISTNAAQSSVADLERKLTPSAQAAELHFAMAAMLRVAPPPQVPPSAVAELFDRYADRFDKHLRGPLEYRAPELLVDAVRALNPPPRQDVLDLGCGTGLCAPLLRPMARLLAGVDLSAAMIEKARERALYDELAIGELVAFMRERPAAFDLLISADVLLYLGDLSPTFEAAARCLRPGGRFAFTLESATGDRYILKSRSRRFAHSMPYVQRLAGIHGFHEEVLAQTSVRSENAQPVPGLLVILRAPAS